MQTLHCLGNVNKQTRRWLPRAVSARYHGKGVNTFWMLALCRSWTTGSLAILWFWQPYGSGCQWLHGCRCIIVMCMCYGYDDILGLVWVYVTVGLGLCYN